MATSRDRNAAFADGRNSKTMVIDGDAVVVERIARIKSAVERAASAPLVYASDDPTVPPPARLFGRHSDRPSLARRRATNEPDLFFQARSMERFAKPARGRQRGVSLFLRDTAGSIPAGGKMAGLGLLVLALLVPAAIVAVSNAPATAARAPVETEGLVIENLDAGVAARGDGEVLKVEGTVRNTSGRTATVPSLRIALATLDGTMAVRPLAIGAAVLAPGGTLRFHSAVAVPVGTDGDVTVAFAKEADYSGTLGSAEATGRDPSASSRKTVTE